MLAADIIMLESSVIVFHFISDVLMYVVGKVLTTETLGLALTDTVSICRQTTMKCCLRQF